MINKKPPNILVTGTPGVGKTSFCGLLQEKLKEMYNLDFNNINIGKLVNEKKLYKQWNDEFNVPEFDDEMVLNEIKVYLDEGGNLFDFHSIGFFPEDKVDLIVLLRCNNTELYDRLKARGYSDSKITENIDCEIMEVTSEEVYSNFNKDIVIELKSETIDQMQENLNKTIEELKTRNLI